MKLSLKLQDHHNQNQSNPLLLRAKIPITIFNLPFLSGFATTTTTTTDPSHLCLSLATNFPSGPTLKFSYTTPTSTAATTTTTTTSPLTLTLKSGTGLFGSPHNSPLIISANLSFSPQNPNTNPTFSLHFSPRLGDFSLRKTTFSNPNTKSNPNPKVNDEVNSFGFVPLEKPMTISWKDLSMESNNYKDSIFSGIAVMARTVLPVTKSIAVNFRWGVDFPADFGKQMPFLSVNKIRIERIDEVKEVKDKSKDGNVREEEVLKDSWFRMRSELDDLQKENREMKHMLEEMKLRNSVRGGRGNGDVFGKKMVPADENSGGIEQWRSKKNSVEENMRKELKKNGNRGNDVESELQKAIKAASS